MQRAEVGAPSRQRAILRRCLPRAPDRTRRARTRPPRTDSAARRSQRGNGGFRIPRARGKATSAATCNRPARGSLRRRVAGRNRVPARPRRQALESPQACEGLWSCRHHWRRRNRKSRPTTGPVSRLRLRSRGHNVLKGYEQPREALGHHAPSARFASTWARDQA